MTDARVAAFAEAFDAGRYFEAHEILEEFWLGHRGEDRAFYQGLIQAAAALHHLGRGNIAGARGLAASCGRRLSAWSPSHEGLDVAGLLAGLRLAIESGGSAPRLEPWPKRRDP